MNQKKSEYVGNYYFGGVNCGEGVGCVPDVGGLYGVVCCGESEIERGGVAYVRYFGVCGDVGQCLGNNMWRQRQLEPIGYGDTYIYIIGRCRPDGGCGLSLLKGAQKKRRTLVLLFCTPSGRGINPHRRA